jgi:hypothetical protein
MFNHNYGLKKWARERVLSLLHTSNFHNLVLIKSNTHTDNTHTDTRTLLSTRIHTKQPGTFLVY